MAIPTFSWRLSPDLDRRVRARIGLLREQEIVGRIWNVDPTVWSGRDEDKWLGWLNLPREQRATVDRAVRLANVIKKEGTADIVLLGMGGSSLAPEVIRS